MRLFPIARPAYPIGRELARLPLHFDWRIDLPRPHSGLETLHPIFLIQLGDERERVFHAHVDAARAQDVAYRVDRLLVVDFVSSQKALLSRLIVAIDSAKDYIPKFVIRNGAKIVFYRHDAEPFDYWQLRLGTGARPVDAGQNPRGSYTQPLYADGPFDFYAARACLP